MLIKLIDVIQNGEEKVGVESCSAELIQGLLKKNNIQFTTPTNPSAELAGLWSEGSTIALILETDHYILTQNHESTFDQNLIQSNFLQEIIAESKVRTPTTELPSIQKNPSILSLEENFYELFVAKLDYLYFGTNNALISISDNLAVAYNFALKKNQQLQSQFTFEKINNEKKVQAIRALKYDLREYSVAIYIPGMCLIGKLGKLIEPRLGKLYQYHPRNLTVPQYTQKKLSQTPKISIVTPSFEQGRYLETTIQSVLNQNYPNIEYVVKDGGSKDDSREILERYTNKLTFWESEPDSGQSQAINTGFAHTNGEIMAWLNSDDLLLPGALHRVAEFFNDHPEIDVLYGNRLLIDENNAEIGRWILPKHSSQALSWADFIPQETLFWRRRIWDKIGGQIDESFRFAMDWDLLLRFREAGAKFAHIPYFLGAFRVHDHQKTTAATDIGADETKRIRKRVFGRVPSRIKMRMALAPFVLQHIAVNLKYLITCRLNRKKYKAVFYQQENMELDE